MELLLDEQDQDLLIYPWHPDARGYPHFNKRGRRIYLHRVVAARKKDPSATYHDLDSRLRVRFKNNKFFDCRRENLRIITYSQMRRESAMHLKRSKYRGVYWDSRHGKFRVVVYYTKNRKRLMKHCGFFDVEDEVEAAKMYDKCAPKYMKHPVLNFIKAKDDAVTNK